MTAGAGPVLRPCRTLLSLRWMGARGCGRYCCVANNLPSAQPKSARSSNSCFWPTTTLPTSSVLRGSQLWQRLANASGSAQKNIFDMRACSPMPIVFGQVSNAPRQHLCCCTRLLRGTHMWGRRTSETPSCSKQQLAPTMTHRIPRNSMRLDMFARRMRGTAPDSHGLQCKCLATLVSYCPLWVVDSNLPAFSLGMKTTAGDHGLVSRMLHCCGRNSYGKYFVKL